MEWPKSVGNWSSWLRESLTSTLSVRFWSPGRNTFTGCLALQSGRLVGSFLALGDSGFETGPRWMLMHTGVLSCGTDGLWASCTLHSLASAGAARSRICFGSRAGSARSGEQAE